MTTNLTIDEKHAELMNDFQKNQTEIMPQLIEEKKKLTEKLKLLKTRTDINLRIQISDEIEKLKEKINKIKNEKKKYLLDNCANLFQYFEEKKRISAGNNNQNINKVKNFFKIKMATNEEEEVDNNKYSKSRNIYNNYWKNINKNMLNFQDFVLQIGNCDECIDGEFIIHEEDGVVMCNKCYKITDYIIESSKPTNKEVPNEVSYTAYIRLNHFKEILSQFQAKETTQIPPEVFEAIKNRIKKERIQNIKDIDNKSMREILRRLRLNKYFEHIQYINSMLGIQPPTMPEKLIETLCVLFVEIQSSWSIHVPTTRTNFFNYTYTLYQLCVLLGQEQYLQFIPLLKDIVKQRLQDELWCKICNDLGWKFCPTI